MQTVRHARLTLSDEQLDRLHVIKRRLSHDREERVTIDDLLREGVVLVLRYYEAQGGNTSEGPEVRP